MAIIPTRSVEGLREVVSEPKVYCPYLGRSWSSVWRGGRFQARTAAVGTGTRYGGEPARGERCGRSRRGGDLPPVPHGATRACTGGRRCQRGSAAHRQVNASRGRFAGNDQPGPRHGRRPRGKLLKTILVDGISCQHVGF